MPQFIFMAYVIMRLFYGNQCASQPTAEAQPCIEAKPCNTGHGYVTATFPDNPGMAIVGSEMALQQVVVSNLTDEQLEAARQNHLYREVEVDRASHAPRIISLKGIKRLKGVCRYLRGTVDVLDDPDGASRPLISLNNGVYFVVGVHGMMAKILLPVKGGYVTYYIPEHRLTDDVRETQDFEVTKGCPDTMTPEKCPSCWPYEHHRSFFLQ